MNDHSSWGTLQKVSLSVLFGIASLLASPYGIEVVLSDITINIPWSLTFPILATLVFGWQYGLISGLSGGAFFPFLLWPEDGWANVSTSSLYVLLYILIGITKDTNYIKHVQNIPLRISLVLLTYISINFTYDHLFFNEILSFNPTFWIKETIQSLPLNILTGFAFKDSINVIACTLAADTLLRLPPIRKVFGLPINPSMKSNTLIFVTTLCIPILVWLTFIGLGSMLLSDNNALLYEHKLFALLVIVANGLLVARLLFHYSETQFRIQHQLNESEDKYKSIFEHVLDVFYQTDLKGNIIEISPSVTSLAGYKREELIGDNFDKFYDTEEDKRLKIEKLLVDGELRNYEAQLKTKDGSLKFISINTRFIPDEKGKPKHIDGVIRDITERKNNELKIEIQNHSLQIKNKELEQFAYITSHDLQEPLQTLISVSNLFKEEFKGKIAPKADTYLNFIDRSSTRMQALIKGLLDYARIGNSDMVKKVDFMQLVNNVLDDLSERIQLNQAKIEVHQLPVLNGYEVELNQLFQNLISNALKFRHENTIPHIIIAAQKQSRKWLFSIQDNGIGIDPEGYEKIFVLFKRLHNRNEYEGTGIGLSHCKKIVALHGGEIWIEPTLGGGSTFYFTISEIENE